MKKLKRIICIIMTAVILAGAPLTSYLEAQAVEVIALPFLEDLLLSLGISFGLGDQLGFWQDSREQALDDYFSAISNGSTITLPNYGPVDFSDSGSVASFFEWSIMCNKALLGGLSPGDHMYLQYHDTASVLDKTSYHNTGTSATNAMNDSISEFYDDYSGSTDALAADIQACFDVIRQGGKFNDDNASDEEKAANRRKFWLTFSAVTAAGMIGYGNGVLPLTALVECSSTDFSEYDALFGDAYFDGEFEMNADGKYVYSVNSSAIRSVPNTYPIEYVSASIYCEFDKKVVAFRSSSNMYNFVYLNASKTSYVSANLLYADSRLGYSSCLEDVTSLNFPLYPDAASALAALKSDDFSGAENLQSSYSDFKTNTKGANAVVGNPFSNYVASLQDFSDLVEIIPGISDASNVYGGTKQALEEVADILNRAAGIAGTDPEPGTDEKESGKDYSGILGKILAAVNSIISFLGKFVTADALANLINGLPALLSPAFVAAVDPVVIAVNAMSAALAKQLIDIFPNSAEVAQAILGFPAAIAAAVAEITFPSITVPDILIPDIVIPEIKIPEIVIPEIKNPAVSVYPNITLDPTYDITVKNDYLGLGDIITDAVEDAGTKLFVPDQTLALEKVGEMQEYFKFTEDIEDIVSEFERKIFGIKPDPILKIPIGKPTSKKYKYGTGSYITIDVSWYAVYKDFGDKIILAFAWAFFIWRIFVNLPGIINGLPGLYETGSQAQTIVSLGKDSKKN